MASHDEPRAAAPRAPEPSRALLRARAEQREHRRERSKAERQSMMRGLAVLGLIVLAASMARAGFERVFVTGWWRHW